MITDVNCDLLLQATCKLVNLSTTTHDLLLQATRKLVNSSTKNKALRMSLIARILIVK